MLMLMEERKTGVEVDGWVSSERDCLNKRREVQGRITRSCQVAVTGQISWNEVDNVVRCDCRVFSVKSSSELF